MLSIRHEAHLAEIATRLAAVEPRFNSVLQTHGTLPMRQMPEGLESLLRIVTDQLISLAAGAAIWKRLETTLGSFDPDAILSAGHENLCAAGLTRAKARAFIAAAEAARRGDLDLAALDDRQARQVLLAIPGVGPWTADVYLLSALGRADAWPAGDMALRAAAEHLFGLPMRPTVRDMENLAENWRPWRAVAARFLWLHYRTIRPAPRNI